MSTSKRPPKRRSLPPSDARDPAPKRRTLPPPEFRAPAQKPEAPRKSMASTLPDASGVARLQASVARLRAARTAAADDIAAMLVRVAETDRERQAAERRASKLEEQVQELQAKLDGNREGTASVRPNKTLDRAQTRISQLAGEVADAHRELQVARAELEQQTEALEVATRHADVADKLAADGVEALAETRAALATAQIRVVDLEARLARERQEQAEHVASLNAGHSEMLSAILAEHAATNRDAELALEDGRSTAAEARERAELAESSLAAARGAIVSVADVLEEVARRDEIATAIRTRAIDQARQLLAGEAQSPSGRAHEPPPFPHDPTLEVVSLDADMDMEMPE